MGIFFALISYKYKAKLNPYMQFVCAKKKLTRTKFYAKINIFSMNKKENIFK